MATMLATIADALIEFILSLLRDPKAAAKFAEDPDRALADAGLSNICVDDVRAVAPVIIDRPDVSPRPPVAPQPVQPPAPPPVIVQPQPPAPPTVIKEITTIANNFRIDARTTIVDQSVNQNIWAKGDVTQIFDQQAIVASGDQSVAAGKDALLDNSTTDVKMGDVAIGNTDTNTQIVGSFNDSSTNTDVVVEIQGSFNESTLNAEPNVLAGVDESVITVINVIDAAVDTTADNGASTSALPADTVGATDGDLTAADVIPVTPPVLSVEADPLDDPLTSYGLSVMDVEAPDALEFEEQ